MNFISQPPTSRQCLLPPVPALLSFPSLIGPPCISNKPVAGRRWSLFRMVRQMICIVHWVTNIPSPDSRRFSALCLYPSTWFRLLHTHHQSRLLKALYLLSTLCRKYVAGGSRPRNGMSSASALEPPNAPPFPAGVAFYPFSRSLTC